MKKTTTLFQYFSFNKKNVICYFILLISISLNAQIISKPTGCFAGTNGTNPLVLAHTESNGVLLIEEWKNIEISPGVYDFTLLNNKISTVTAAGLKYSLAIAGGAFGSPDWLIDSLQADFLTFQYQSQNFRLPFWWDTVCENKLNELIFQLGNEYATDSFLSHIYVTQMTTNGIEGHLNGVDMTSFATAGYTAEKWISAAENTIHSFAEAFPNKPIVFEIHEINQDTIVPMTIIQNVINNELLCKRFGIGMWWISGKTTYQENLIDAIYNFKGDKYAQVIGRSDQPHRFKDSLYHTVFTQAKYLGIRYIEPWPYEFQFNTNDSLFHDFNVWAAAKFSTSDTCQTIDVAIKEVNSSKIKIFPNPSKNYLNISTKIPYKNMEVSLYNKLGQLILQESNQSTIDIHFIPNGLFFVKIRLDEAVYTQKIVKRD